MGGREARALLLALLALLLRLGARDPVLAAEARLAVRRETAEAAEAGADPERLLTRLVVRADPRELVRASSPPDPVPTPLSPVADSAGLGELERRSQETQLVQSVSQFFISPIATKALLGRQDSIPYPSSVP